MSDKTVILVLGGRDFLDYGMVRTVLGKLINPEFNRDRFTVLVGDARGIDNLVMSWCRTNGVPMVVIPLLVSFYGLEEAKSKRLAQQLAMKPSLVLAFPGDREVTETCAFCEECGIEVHLAEIYLDAKKVV